MLIQATADKQRYVHRDKIDIDLLTTNQSGDPLVSNLSATVFRLDSLHTSSKEDIFSYLWLSSYCTGYIEDPAYYFKNENAQTNADLDNLLLTQGWRTFDWNSVLQAKPYLFTYIPEIMAISLPAKSQMVIQESLHRESSCFYRCRVNAFRYMAA